MKKLILTVCAMAAINFSHAQVFKRLADRAKNKMEQKAGEKVDKQIDDAVDGKKKEKKKTGSENNESSSDNSSSDNAATSSQEETAASSSNNSNKPTPPASLKTYSKYDFVPGEKILILENFDQDAIGDFPGKWNTNSSGEIVTLEGKEGKWFQIKKEGAFHPEFITAFPNNFTLEFDLGVNNDFSYYSSPLFLTFLNMGKAETEYSNWGNFSRWNGKHAVRINFHPSNSSSHGSSRVVTSVDGSSYLIDNNVAVNEFSAKNKNIVHISIWRQNQRMRVYVNNEKIWDLPKAFGSDAIYNSMVLGLTGMNQDQDFYVLNNIRLAVGAPDTRNKLITEGKFVTHGILFDVNSDAIKAESYGAIKDIANVLKENATVKVKIIGHTDADGDDNSNLDLSKRRAQAVKKALIDEFAIDEGRLQTDGKGESQPIDKADTPVAKANNRRVEFIRL